MKTMTLVLLIICFTISCPYATENIWSGVDKTVVEKYAVEANRPPHEPFINTDQGDLLLFVFLIAGAIGGFTGGYFFRELFPSRRKREMMEDV